MKLTRKNFLKSGMLTAGGILLQGHKFPAWVDEKPNGFKEIRQNIGVYTERGGTIGWFASNDAVIVVDSQFPDTAKNFMESLQKKTQRKIDLLFNTHHHGDHTAGNLYLKDYTSLIAAHVNCPLLQKKRNLGTDKEKLQVYANLTFNDEWSFDLGDEKVWAKHISPAHTGGDAVLHFQNSNVVHMGDLVFNKVFPVMDGPGGCSIKGWITFLENIVPYFSKDTAYIFGHAPSPELVTGSVEDVNAMRIFLSALMDFVDKEIKNGKTKGQIAAANEIPGVKDIKELWKGARKSNLEFVYDELSNIKY